MLALANAALRDAIATLAPDQHPLVHSDQGFQNQHRSWRALLAEASATPSMSRKVNGLDNADLPPARIFHRPVAELIAFRPPTFIRQGARPYSPLLRSPLRWR